MKELKCSKCNIVQPREHFRKKLITRQCKFCESKARSLRKKKAKELNK